MESKIQQIVNEVSKVITGKEEVVKKVVCGIVAGGSVLIEDVPGVGKTTLALAISKVLGLDFKRVQFTPDTVASDIIGYTAYDKKSEKFVYHKGAAMTNILLADEINRTSGKTHSALLEVMEEGNCTVDGVTYPVPTPFSVIATQNPIGSAGTTKLPNSQLDRFLIKVNIGYPDHESMKKMLRDRHNTNPLANIRKLFTNDELLEIVEECSNIYVDEKIYDYIAILCEKSHECEEIAVGISPRGALALCKMAKATAFSNGRDFVTDADVRANFIDVCAHRIVLSSASRIAGKTEEALLDELLNQTILTEK